MKRKSARGIWRLFKSADPENHRSRVSHVESLERRRLLTISTTSWFSELLQTGTSETTQSVTSGQPTTTFIQTCKGPTTFNGIACVELDTNVNGISNVGTSYAGTDNAGDLVVYSSTTALSGNTQSDVYTPYEMSCPASLTAGVTYTFTDSDANSTNNTTTGMSNVTYTDTEQFTLASETPSPITAGGNTYQAYQVTEVDSSTGSDGSTSGPDTIVTWYAPNVGPVKSTNQSSGAVTTLTNFTGNLKHLAVTQQPTTAVFNETMNPVKVTLQNGDNTTDSSSSDAVTVNVSLTPLGSSTGTLTATSTTSASTAGGVATFDNLAVTKPGQYMLSFSDSAGRVISSQMFDVSAGFLKFKRGASEGTVGMALDPAIEVELVNSKGKVITDAPSMVTLTITTGDPTAKITGNTAAQTGGTALFNNLKLDLPGSYTLTASDDQGDVTALSTELKINGTHLAFRREPMNTGIGKRLLYTIVLEDSRNRVINNSTDGVQLTLNTIQGGQDAKLSSTGDTLFFGMASNDTEPFVSINSPGRYTLTATEIAGVNSTSNVAATIPAMSKPFDVSGNHLVFRGQPHNSGVNIRLIYTVEMLDYKNHVVDSGDQLNFTLNIDSGGVGAMLASTVDQLVGGTAENMSSASPVPLSINSAGMYWLTVVDVPAAGETAAESAQSKVFRVFTSSK